MHNERIAFVASRHYSDLILQIFDGVLSATLSIWDVRRGLDLVVLLLIFLAEASDKQLFIYLVSNLPSLLALSRRQKATSVTSRERLRNGDWPFFGFADAAALFVGEFGFVVPQVP